MKKLTIIIISVVAICLVGFMILETYANTPGPCLGTATACSALTNYTQCVNQLGCSSAGCSGTVANPPSDCGAYPSCNAGCAPYNHPDFGWMCVAITDCTYFNDPGLIEVCDAVEGCTFTCTGTETACDGLNEAQCGTSVSNPQYGCYWYNSCTYSGDGNWDIESSHNCDIVGTNVNGRCNFINDYGNGTTTLVSGQLICKGKWQAIGHNFLRKTGTSLLLKPN